MPVIDVFIAFKMYSIGTNPKTGKDIQKPERLDGGKNYPIPDWVATQKVASNRGSIVNIYEEENGTCNKNTFLKSLTTPGRIVVFAGHSWTDGRNRNGRDEVGFGIRIRDGQYLGTFGITQARTNASGLTYGEYSPIPIIKASRLFIFSCNPGSDFREIMRKHLKRGSLAYYVYAGNDNVVWIPALEAAAYKAVSSLIIHQEAKAISDANAILSSSIPFSNGDRMKYVWEPDRQRYEKNRLLKTVQDRFRSNIPLFFSKLFRQFSQSKS